MPGDAIKLCSADSMEDPNDTFWFNIEYLNTLRSNDLPRHKTFQSQVDHVLLMAAPTYI